MDEEGQCPPGCRAELLTCVCDTYVTLGPAFVDTVPSLAEAKEELFFGAAKPELFEQGTYDLCTHPLCETAAEEGA